MRMRVIGRVVYLLCAVVVGACAVESPSPPSTQADEPVGQVQQAAVGIQCMLPACMDSCSLFDGTISCQQDGATWSCECVLGGGVVFCAFSC